MSADSGTVVWRSGKQIGAAVRGARERMGLTQAELARRAAVGLKFLYELESGKDTLRADKVLDVLEVLALELVVTPSEPAAVGTDYIGMACTTASVSMRKVLAPDELVRALLTGKPTPGKRPHFVVLLEEAPLGLLQGLVAQVGAWAKPGQVARNVRKIAGAIGVPLRRGEWLKTA